MPTNSTADLIDEFRNCQDNCRMEELADLIGDVGGSGAVEVLLERLSGDRVQDDRDVESAVCDALVKLGAMRPDGGNLHYKFLDDGSLRPEHAELLNRYRPCLRRKYFEA